MKRFLALLCLVVATISSCSDDDLDNNSYLESFEAWQESITNDISSVIKLITAIESHDYVASVTPLADGTGYVLNMANSGDVTIKHGSVGQAVVVSAKLDSDNKYYWTVGGEWLKSGGAKVAVSGSAPQVKANTTTKKWEVSVDGGATWIATNLEVQSGSIFATNSIDDSNEKYVSLTLADGTVIQITRSMPLHFAGEDEPGVLYMGVEQGNSRTLEVAVPADVTADNYVGMTVSITGDWGTTTHDVTRSSGAEAWLNVEIQPITFSPTTGKKIANPKVFFYIDPNQVKVGQIATVKTTIATLTSSFKTNTTIKPTLWAPLDIYKINDDPYGIILRAKTHDKLGLIVGLDEEKVLWSTEHVEIANANSDSDGAANTAAVLGLSSYTAEKYPIFAWCAAKNETAPTGIKWYIPAKDELVDIDNKKHFLNAALVSIKATQLVDAEYWSSTQIDDNKAWGVNLYGDTTSRTHKNYSSLIRLFSAY